MRANKKRRLDLFPNPLKNLPNLIKIVKEEKLKKSETVNKKNKKAKYSMKDKFGTYIL